MTLTETINKLRNTNLSASGIAYSNTRILQASSNDFAWYQGSIFIDYYALDEVVEKLQELFGDDEN